MSNSFGTCRSFAAGLPGAWEDSPWDESLVTKAGKKIFVFFGSTDEPSFSVKLPESSDHALSLSAGLPTSYGLGRHQWVSLDLTAADCPETEVLLDWIEESYRAIAPTMLVAELDAG